MSASRALVLVAIRFHRFLYRVTGGRVGHFLGSLEQVLVTTTGRRSGTSRTTPLMVTPVDDRWVLVASWGGSPRHPDWYLNLVADPDVRVQRGRHTYEMRARTASGPERAELWERAVAANPGYAGYQRKTTRQIPVVVLERVSV